MLTFAVDRHVALSLLFMRNDKYEASVCINYELACCIAVCYFSVYVAQAKVTKKMQKKHKYDYINCGAEMDSDNTTHCFKRSTELFV